jgi:hypothetical protein
MLCRVFRSTWNFVKGKQVLVGNDDDDDGDASDHGWWWE